MMKRVFLILIILGQGLSLVAQNTMQRASIDILSNSLILKAQSVETQMKILEDKSDLIPGDPEFVGAYLWGSPSFIGNRTNLNANQKFKFPTYYAKQKKVNSLSADLYNLDMDSEVNKVLFESLDLMVEIAHLAEKKQIVLQRLERLKQIHDLADAMFIEGEINRIELEKSSLLLETYQQDLLMINSEEDIFHRQLIGLNAGENLDIQELKYEDLEMIFSGRKAMDAMADNPLAETAALNQRIAEAGVGLAKTGYLPDLQIGYASESINEEKLAGIEFGLSIPIWGKSNKVKQAKLNRELTDHQKSFTQIMIKNDWDNLNEMARQSMEIQKNLETSLGSMKTQELLEQSWKSGEISLLDYLKELPFYYGVEDRIIEAEKHYYKAMLLRNRNHLKGMLGL